MATGVPKTTEHNTGDRSTTRTGTKLLCWNDKESFVCSGWCFRRRTLESVANSQVVSVGILLTLRVSSLLFLLLGGFGIAWRSWERPLCLPEWSYIALTLYFVVSKQNNTLLGAKIISG